jgi:xanthine dehydrogenase accessory factor
MSEVWRGLLESLDGGRTAAVVTEYNDDGVKRSLVREDDHAAWNGLGQAEDGIGLARGGGGYVMTECYAPKPRLIIFGGGHIALPLCDIGAMLGFSVMVFDDRPSFVNEARFPSAEAVICDSFDNVTRHISVNKSDYVVIVTRGHRHDSQCLRRILEGEFPRYAGMIGSRRRVAVVKKQIEDEIGESEKLARLHAPIGLAIGALTPEEIAVSILAEVISEMRLGSAGDPSAPREFICPDMELLTWLAKNTERAAIATVVETDGSTPREAGAKMAILPHGQTIGSIGGGCAEADVTLKAADIIRDGGYCVIDIDLTDTAEEDGMACGGVMKVLLEAL